MHSDMRERERDRDTDTDRQKQTQTERQTDKERERENIFFKEILLWTTRPGTERDRQREREYFFQRDPTLDHKALPKDDSIHYAGCVNTIQIYCLCVEKFAFWLVLYIKH